MNPQELKPLALILAAALSCGAFAQGGSGQATATPPATAAAPATPPATPNPNPTPSPAPTNMPPANPSLPQTPAQATTPGTAGTSTNMATNSQQVFATLGRSHKGYLSEADVASNSFLAGNFKKCDANNDGRLNESEVAMCMPPPGH